LPSWILSSGPCSSAPSKKRGKARAEIVKMLQGFGCEQGGFMDNFDNPKSRSWKQVGYGYRFGGKSPTARQFNFGDVEPLVFRAADQSLRRILMRAIAEFRIIAPCCWRSRIAVVRCSFAHRLSGGPAMS
jgi:hypothetical protein